MDSVDVPKKEKKTNYDALPAPSVGDNPAPGDTREYLQYNVPYSYTIPSLCREGIL